MRTRYRLEMTEEGLRFWDCRLDDEGAMPDPLPPGFELRFYSEPPVDGKVDGEAVAADVDLRLPLGTTVTLEVPDPADSRKLEAAALSRVLRRQLLEGARASGRPVSEDAAGRILVEALRRLEARGKAGDFRTGQTTRKIDPELAAEIVRCLTGPGPVDGKGPGT